MAYPISDVTRRVVYSGSAGTGPYSFSFEVLANTDIAVYKNTTLLTLTTDYSVTINSNGTGSVTLVSAATGSDNITLVGNRSIERATDFVTGGDLFANSLNDEFDSLVIFSQQVKEEAGRGLKAPITDPTDVNMTLPVKATRKGTVLAFNATTGNPEAGPSIASVTTVAAQSANINTVATNISSVNTVAGNNSNVTTVAGISGNVTTVAGISSNVTSVAGNASNINTVAGISANVTTVAGISSSVTSVAGNSTNINAVNSNSTNINTCATNISAIIDAPNQATAAAASAASAAASAAAGMYSAVQDKSANYTVVAGDAGDLIRVTTTSGAITITLPTISTVGDGFKVAIVKWTSDGNAVSVVRSSTNTINGATSYSISTQYSSATFVADLETGQWFAVSGLSGATTGSGAVVLATSPTITTPAISGDATVSGTLTATGVGGLTINKSAAAGTASLVLANSPSGDGVGRVNFVTSSTATNWSINTNTVVGGELNFTPSTAGGGSTFTTPALTISNASNVGVGTSSPARKLHVVSTSLPQFRVDYNGTYYFDISNNGAFNITDPTSSNVYVFQRNGAEQMRLDSSGNLGIGTSSPAQRLDVQGSSSSTAIGTSASIEINSSTGLSDPAGITLLTAVIDSATAGDRGTALAFSTSRTAGTAERMRIDSSGNVGIGTSSPTSSLVVAGAASGTPTVNGVHLGVQGSYATIELCNTSGAFIDFTSSGTDNKGRILYDNTNNFMSLATNGNERARIDSSGNLLVGTTSGSTPNPGVVLNPGTNSAIQIGHGSGAVSGSSFAVFRYNGTAIGYIDQNGTTGVTFATSSDYRLKNITGPITTSGSYIDSLNPVEGTWKADGSTFVGLIAHETQEASRTTVATGVKDGVEMQGMDYSSAEIIANLIAEIQSLRKRLAAAGI